MQGIELTTGDFQLFMDNAKFYDGDMKKWKIRGVETEKMSHKFGSSQVNMIMKYHPLDGEMYTLRNCMDLGRRKNFVLHFLFFEIEIAPFFHFS